jgi:hypothetical protein
MILRMLRHQAIDDWYGRITKTIFQVLAFTFPIPAKPQRFGWLDHEHILLFDRFPGFIFRDEHFV